MITPIDILKNFVIILDVVDVFLLLLVMTLIPLKITGKWFEDYRITECFAMGMTFIMFLVSCCFSHLLTQPNTFPYEQLNPIVNNFRFLTIGNMLLLVIYYFSVFIDNETNRRKYT